MTKLQFKRAVKLALTDPSIDSIKAFHSDQFLGYGEASFKCYATIRQVAELIKLESYQMNCEFDLSAIEKLERHICKFEILD